MDAAALQQLEAYLDSLRFQRRLSPHTLAAYGRDLRQLRDYCERRGLSDWQALKAADLRQYLAQRHREQLGSRSLHRALSAQRGFFAWLIRGGELAGDPTVGLRAPKAPRRLPKPCASRRDSICRPNCSIAPQRSCRLVSSSAWPRHGR